MTGEEPEPLDLAMQSLEAAFQRHWDARERRVLVDAFASAAETLWWICTIDDKLGGKGTAYAQARDRDEFGRYIPGLRWIRGKFTHALALTTEEDLTPFFPGPPFHLSKVFMWKASSEILQRDDDEHPYGRDRYDELIAGMSTKTTLARASSWLRKYTGREGS